MMYTRYHAAAKLASGRRVLELGCGAGQGLGLLAAQASVAVGGDFSWPLLATASQHYQQRVPLARLSAEALPFASGSFDAVFLFEASYYIPSMQRAFDEIARVLAPGGIVMFVNANPERPDFIRSPHSVHYHTADEFRQALEALSFDVLVEGAFPVGEDKGRRSWKTGKALSVVRQVLERLHLVPKTLRGRAMLKRLLYGRSLISVPSEIRPGFAREAEREPLPSGPANRHKVIYVTATRGLSRATSSRNRTISP